MEGGFIVKGDLVVVSPTEVLSPGWVEVGPDGIITHVSSSAIGEPGKVVHEAPVVVPGFVDIHNHGTGGTDNVATYWQNPAHTLRAMAKTGTTACLATLVIPSSSTSHIGCAAGISPCLHDSRPDGKPPVDLEAAVGDSDKPVVPDRLKACIGVPSPGCAVCEGVHAEGPIIADYGGLPTSDTEMPLERFCALLDALVGLRVMTISPSKDSSEGYPRIRELLKRGIVPALGHDKVATEAQILGALRVAAEMGDGVSSPRPHITHLFNVTTFHHRTPGLTNIGLLSTYPRLPQYKGIMEPTIELIGDLLHVSPVALQLALSSKSPDKIAFITDAVADPVLGTKIAYETRTMEVIDASAHPDHAAGSGDSITGTAHSFSDSRGAAPSSTSASTEPSACVVLEGTSTLAGSCTTMFAIFKRLIGVFGKSFQEAVQACSTTPASVARLTHLGGLHVGKRADILLLSGKDTHAGAGEGFDGGSSGDITLMKVFVAGREIK